MLINPAVKSKATAREAMKGGTDQPADQVLLVEGRNQGQQDQGQQGDQAQPG
jgi:hypothetical protein